MLCPVHSSENSEILLDYCSGRLTPDVAWLLERHMEKCPDCRAFEEAQAAVWTALDEFDRLPVEQSFDADLMRKIREDRLAEPPPRPVWSRLRARAAVAAAFAVLVLGALQTWPAPSASATVEAPAMEMPDPDLVQVERTLEDLEMLRALPSNL